jgi:WD40 repeat protein
MSLVQELIQADRASRESAFWYKTYIEQKRRNQEIARYVNPVFDAYEHYRNAFLLTKLQDELGNHHAHTDGQEPETREFFQRLETSVNQKSKQIESQQSLLNDLQSQLSAKETEVKSLTSKLSLAVSQSSQLQLQLESTHKLLEEKMTEIIRLKEELRAADDVDKMELIEKIDRSEEASTVDDQSGLTQFIPKKLFKSYSVPHMEGGANFLSLAGPIGGHQTLLLGSRVLHGLDAETGETRFEIASPGSSGTSTCASLSTDNEIGIMGSSESQLAVFDCMSKKILKDLKGHGGKIKGCGFLGNRTKAFSVATDRTIKIWDLNRGGPIRSVPVVSQLVHGVSSQDGSLIVTGHLNGKISIWTQSDKVCEVSAHSESCVGLALSSDARYIASLGKDGSLALIDMNMANAGPLYTLRGFSLPTVDTNPVFSPDTRMVAACTNGSVCIWDCITGKPLTQLETDAFGLCWLYSRSTLVTCSPSGQLKWWRP